MSSRYDNPDYTDWQISMVNSTCRTTTRSVVLRYLEKHYSVVPWLPILDYGAGKKAAHTAYLRSIGFTDVTAFDIGRNFTPGVHSPDALQRKYSLVFASNVLNVQPNLSLLRETLEEIAMENRDVFLEAGGKRYEYIPCLNSSAEHIQMMASLVQQHSAGWPLYNQTPQLAQARQDSRERAKRLGADK